MSLAHVTVITVTMYIVGSNRYNPAEPEGAIMFGKLGMPELLVIAAIALIIFGPSKLGELGKGLGEGIRSFKSAVKDDPQTK